MEEPSLQKISEFLGIRTANGLYPIVAYGLDGQRVCLLTTNIADLPLAMQILSVATRKDYNLGLSFKRSVLEKIANDNPHVFRIHSEDIPGISTQDLTDLGRIVAMFGAPFYRQKAFGLVDICGFSRLTHSEQLSQLYSLTNIVTSSVRRTYKFCTRLNIPSAFGKTSTGDGYYLWHDLVGGNADVATFMLFLCIMTQAEAIRQGGFPMRLKGTFVIDSAFMIYSPERPVSLRTVASNAVGQATNGAARLMTAAKPSQILVGEFVRTGQGKEKMNPRSLIAQANELFREESAGAASLAVNPDEMLRVTDKHGDSWYCWNLCGEVPNEVNGNHTRQPIGLRPDATKDIVKIAFQSDPEGDTIAKQTSI